MSEDDFSDILLREPRCKHFNYSGMQMISITNDTQINRIFSQPVTRHKLKRLKASGYNKSCRVLIVRKRGLDALALLGRPGRRIQRIRSLGGMNAYAYSPNSSVNQSTSDSVRAPPPDLSENGVELSASPQNLTNDSAPSNISRSFGK